MEKIYSWNSNHSIFSILNSILTRCLLEKINICRQQYGWLVASTSCVSWFIWHLLARPRHTSPACYSYLPLFRLVRQFFGQPRTMLFDIMFFVQLFGKIKSCLDLFLTRTRLKFGERAFSVAAPKALNKLPLDVHTVTNTDTFKTKLKTFLFPAVN